MQDWFQLVCCCPVLIYLQGGLEPWCCLSAKPKWNILTSDECSPVLGSERPGGSPYQLVWDWSGILLWATWLERHKRPLLRWQCGFPETKVPCTYLGGSLPKMKHVLNNRERVLETGAGVWDLSDVCLYFGVLFLYPYPLPLLNSEVSILCRGLWVFSVIWPCVLAEVGSVNGIMGTIFCYFLKFIIYLLILVVRVQ